jgi:hypothetical protein
MLTTGYYSIIRYVPDIIRDECINIGVILETGENGDRARHLLITDKFNRAAKIDPNLKNAVVERIIRNALAQIDRETGNMTLDDLVENYSASKVQFSLPRLTIADNLEQEIRELFTQFVVEEKEERHHGITEPILRKEVRGGLAQHGINGGRVQFSTNKTPLLVRGKRATHSFDISVQVNSHHDYIRCISFDVDNYALKLDAAKVLVYDAKDVKEKYERADVISILYPPKTQRGKKPEEMFREARTILKDEGVLAFNFDSPKDRKELLEVINPLDDTQQ